ncbi:hypothetical protein RHSIM_Rhsim11G0140700 [Rhododendron simsii]|uniref:Legume lectin domain-containing protein n=1 Tax=Rhododendron simsii TaxID=118357 RepID=A0A834G695_RHOSS|nr:hypothetical protein RHSIM_Rhsim11G0140700 [Rhododendron simsii]
MAVKGLVRRKKSPVQKEWNKKGTIVGTTISSVDNALADELKKLRVALVERHDILIESDQGLEITPSARGTNLLNKTGKVTYKESLHLWDNSTSTRNLTNFSTHFVFVIDSQRGTNFGDGLTFFLTPNGSNFATGLAMGLPIDPVTLVHTSPFVAVEFDTYKNRDLDPGRLDQAHVGIDVNSLNSSVTAVWYCNITHGKKNEAWIREYLPEKVTFGFSASTGASFETHTIKSWDFNSSLEINETDKTVTVNTGNRTVIDPVKPGSKKISLEAVVGLVVGSVVLVGGFVLVGFGFWKRSTRAKEEDEFEVEMSMENDFESESQMRLVEWVWDLYGMGRLLEAVDAKLGSDFDEQQAERLMIVGLWCAHPDLNFRAKIRQAIHVLNFEAPLPILPPKLPALSFFSLPLNTTTTSSDTSQYQYSRYTSNTDSSKFTSSSTASSPSISLLYKE